jgi:formylmethanofuran dehydrogenase subunit C
MFKFINAQEMHKKHPDTFEAPTKEELNAITLNNSVKVCHNDERFWVTVTAINKDIVTGTIDNDLVCRQPFKFGDEIKFKKHHIYSIYS